MERRARILEIIRSISRQEVNPAPDQSLFESGLVDSFALPEMVSALEREFSIAIPDSDLIPRRFETLERIESYIEGHS
jgi:acyl carrier protein